MYEGSNIEDITNVPSWEKCAGHCMNNKACKVWTWRSSDPPFRCWLKSETTGSTKMQNRISGTRICGMETGRVVNENIILLSTALKLKLIERKSFTNAIQ